MADEKKKKRPRDRKNPGMANKYKAERKAKNASRPKQNWVGAIDVDNGGHWERL